MLFNPPGPACVVWETTLACNLSCAHCGASAGKKRQDELSTREALALCRQLKNCGTRAVALMGGEPFLRRDWREIADRIKLLGMEFSIITNGTTAGAAEIKALSPLKPRAVAVSLDAADAGIHDTIRGAKGAFSKAWGFINLARKAGLPVSVITTVHKKNLAQLAPLMKLLKNKNIAWQVQTAGAEGARFPKSWLLSPEEFYSVGLFVASARKLCSVRELPVIGAHDLGYNSAVLGELGLCAWRGCQAGITVAGIQSDGGVKPCLAAAGAPHSNIRDKSFGAIWRSKTFAASTRGFNAAALGPNCRNCRHNNVCKGGCAEMSLMLTGKPHNNPYCFHKIEQAAGIGGKPFKSEPAAALQKRFSGQL